MSYKLVVTPMTYNKYLHKKSKESTCIYCSERLELIDEFMNVKDLPDMDIVLKVCFQSVLNAVLDI